MFAAFRRRAANFRNNVQKPEYVAEAWASARYFLYAGSAVYVFRTYGVKPTICKGPSMLPTFNSWGDLLLQEYFSVYTERIRVGDVVMSRSPRNPKHIVCKRVLGLAGDTVHVPRTTLRGPLSVKVPEGHVWLQGDNPTNSTDSRQYGPVPYALLEGRAFLKIWPLREAGWVQNKLPGPAGF